MAQNSTGRTARTCLASGSHKDARGGTLAARPPTQAALAVFGSTLFALVLGLRSGAGMHLSLFFGLVASCAGARVLGVSWDRIQSALFAGIADGLPAVSILVLIGMLVGLWTAGGTIPTLLTYGLSWLVPGWLVPTSCLLSCVASVATGTSFGTISTVGLALMGVGEAMGVPAPLLAGAVVSGAYFGDKISPLSDTTNVAPAVSGSNLYDHIASMAITTLPALALSLVGFFILGNAAQGPGAAPGTVQALRSVLHSTFRIGPVTLIPIAVLVVLCIKRVPPLPALTAVLAVSLLTALWTQGSPLSSLAQAMVGGYSARSGNLLIDRLLSRGGMNSMLPTVFLVMMATGMGGVLREAGVIQRIVDTVLARVSSDRALILSTGASCYLTLLATGNQMLALILPGQAFREAFRQKGIPARILSRTLEDFGTLGAPLVPWSTAALFIYDMLKVPAVQYAPYALLNWLSPALAVFYAMAGLFLGQTDQRGFLQERVAKEQAGSTEKP